VVSAIGGATDQLLSHASQYGERTTSVGIAALAAIGEARAAALLTLALDRAGVPANTLDAAAIGLSTLGDQLNSSPHTVNIDAIKAAFADAPVLVVPGFVGRDALGRATLLGRGGSDFTAVYIAAALSCECVLVKDVDALFDRDPSVDPVHAQRLIEANYDDVLALSEGIVQHKAVRFVQERGVRVSIARVGHHAGTVIHGGPTKRGEVGVRTRSRPLRVVVLGVGAVGKGVVDHILRLPDIFQLVAVIARNVAKAQSNVGAAVRVLSDPIKAAQTLECDIIVEALGGIEPATAAIHAALERSIHVVSANKAAIAASLTSLRAFASVKNAQLRFSAAVGGGVPVLERVRAIALHSDIVEVRGVINGTTNFVLDRLHAGVAFKDAVLAAQQAGLAEADPSSDLDGWDASYKLMLIADAAWGSVVPLDRIHRESIRAIDTQQARQASESGQVYRVIASLVRDSHGEVCGDVRPVRVQRDDPLARATDEHNCVLIRTRDGAQHVLRGRGAGRFPTAESVLGDLLDLATDFASPRASTNQTQTLIAEGINR